VIEEEKHSLKISEIEKKRQREIDTLDVSIRDGDKERKNEQSEITQSLALFIQRRWTQVDSNVVR
jgi:hypothetical protein